MSIKFHKALHFLTRCQRPVKGSSLGCQWKPTHHPNNVFNASQASGGRNWFRNKNSVIFLQFENFNIFFTKMATLQIQIFIEMTSVAMNNIDHLFYYKSDKTQRPWPMESDAHRCHFAKINFVKFIFSVFLRMAG